MPKGGKRKGAGRPMQIIDRQVKYVSMGRIHWERVAAWRKKYGLRSRSEALRQIVEESREPC